MECVGEGSADSGQNEILKDVEVMREGRDNGRRRLRSTNNPDTTQRLACKDGQMLVRELPLCSSTGISADKPVVSSRSLPIRQPFPKHYHGQAPATGNGLMLRGDSPG